jgi:hypothetical protein
MVRFLRLRLAGALVALGIFFVSDQTVDGFDDRTHLN